VFLLHSSLYLIEHVLSQVFIICTYLTFDLENCDLEGQMLANIRIEFVVFANASILRGIGYSRLIRSLTMDI